jgi:putative nucleotidyltransferase with HDIG domain
MPESRAQGAVQPPADARTSSPRPSPGVVPRFGVLVRRLLGVAPGGPGPGTYVFIAIVFGVWLAVAGLTLPTLSRDELLLLLPIVVLTALVQRFELGLYASNTFVTLGLVGNLAAGMLLGVPGAIASSAVAVLSGQRSRGRLRALAFNLGSVGLSNAAAAGVFVLIVRLVPGDGPVSRMPGAIVAGSLVYLCESAFVTLIVALTRGLSPKRVWEENYRWLLPHMMGLGLVALGLAETHRSVGIAGLLAFAGPALLMRYSMKQYLDRTTRNVQELSERNEELQHANREIQAMTVQIREAYSGTLEALVAALDARDRETYGHSTRVAKMTMVLARQLGIEEDSRQWVTIERGALLHDVGKIGVPDAILRKPGKLNDDEWMDMRRHARIGYDVLKDVPFLAGAAEIVAAHHESWDGTGYPMGLAGEEIPFGARVFMVADAFDAMATDRPYRRARPYPDCLEEIIRCSGTQFDPVVVETLRAVFPQWAEMHRQALEQSGARRMSVVA